ncbi:MAG: autotransporter-associated beta strand repeat-containing protein, partial [Verrucomicrobiota bacterium]
MKTSTSPIPAFRSLLAHRPFAFGGWVFACLVFAWLFCLPNVHAANTNNTLSIFSSGTSWTTAANWTPSGVPGGAGTGGPCTNVLFSTYVPAVTTLDGGINSINGMSFNTANTMEVRANASGTTTRGFYLTADGGTNATGDMANISLTGGGNISFGVTPGYGAITFNCGNAAMAITNYSGTLTFGPYCSNPNNYLTLTYLGLGSSKLEIDGTNAWASDTVAISIYGGIVGLGNNQALGITSSGAKRTTVASGAAVQVNGSGLLFSNTLNTLRGTGPTNGGALENLANNNTWSGAITLGTGGARINSDSGTLTLSGGVTGSGLPLTIGGAGNVTVSTAAIGTVAGTLTYDGSGTLTLNYANTYTGLSTVSAGIVDVQNNTGLGTTAGATTVASGAAVQVDGNGLSIGEPLNTLIGTGISSGGALRNLANNNTWSGAITLGTGGARINSDGGTLTLSGGVTGAGLPLTIGGAGNVTVSTGVIGTTTGTLTYDGSGTLTLGSLANTFSGAVAVSGGTLSIASDGTGSSNPLGAYPGSVTAAAVTLNAATLLATANTTISVNRGITLGASGGTLDASSGQTLTVNSVIAGSGNNLTKGINTGTVSLGTANTYSGNTTISAGTLTLNGGTIASTPQISIASGATFDVSAAGITLTGSSPQQTLAGSSTSGAASINAPSQTVTLASGALLSFQAAGGGSTTVGEISVTGGLTLNANAVTVNVTGPALAAGTYRLLDCTGTLANTGTFGTPTITGTPLSSGYTASISVTTGSPGHVDLNVNSLLPIPTFSNLANKSVTYGTASLTLTGTLSASGPTYPVNGSTVTASINGHAVSGTVTDSSGDFSINYNDASLATDSVNGGTPYTITYSFGGDANLAAAVPDTTTTLTVTKQTPVIVTGPTATAIKYGQTVTSSTLSGGTVTNAAGGTVTGSFTFTTPGITATYVGTTNVAVTFTPTDATDYNTNTATVSVTINQLPVVLTGTRAYDLTTNVAAAILSVSNLVDSDSVTLSGSVGLASAAVGTNLITSFNALSLGGASSANYTLTGASGAV